MSVFGTRPEVIKLSPLLRLFKEDDRFSSIVVSTSQHREMIEDLLEIFSIVPDHDLKVIQKEQTLHDITTRGLTALGPVLAQSRPDLVIVQGDTTSAFLGALAAFYRKIPVGHVEAGLRSLDRMHPYPEEVNRRMISSLSDLHFAPTSGNYQNLIQERIDADRIFVTGNTVIDSLRLLAARTGTSLADYLPQFSCSSRLILVTAHRRENIGIPLARLCQGLIELASQFEDVEIVFPVHLNPKVRAIVEPLLGNRERIHLIEPLPYPAMIEVLKRAYLVVTDSGGIQEEGLAFSKPILVYRKVTERLEGIDGGGVRIIGCSREILVRTSSRLLSDQAAYQKMQTGSSPYGDGYAAERIAQGILCFFNRAQRPRGFHPDRTHLGGKSYASRR
jgi:UDP-N-acetylglucosamine 2-epimerase